MGKDTITKKMENLKQEFNLIVEAAKQLKIDQQKDLIGLQSLQAVYREFETLTVNEEISQNESIVNLIQGRMDELKTEFEDTKARLTEYATRGQQYSTEMRSLQRSYKEIEELKQELEIESVTEELSPEDIKIEEAPKKEEKGKKDASKE